MKYIYKIIILLVFLILLTFIFNKNNKSNFSNSSLCPPINVISINKYNPNSLYNKVLVLGGVHGNEYGPSFGIEEFCKENNNKLNGNITFIPRVNSEGIDKQTRYLPCKSNLLTNYDINRNFTENKINDFQKKIINMVKDHDIVLDFHEGYGFHKINNNSVGSSVMPGYKYSNNKIYPKLKKISEKLLNTINLTIDTDNQKFTIITDQKYYIKNTLRDYCEKINKPYILIEITGHNNKQPLNIRKDQSKIILTQFLKELNIYI